MRPGVFKWEKSSQRENLISTLFYFRGWHMRGIIDYQWVIKGNRTSLKTVFSKTGPVHRQNGLIRHCAPGHCKCAIRTRRPFVCNGNEGQDAAKTIKHFSLRSDKFRSLAFVHE